MRLLFWIFIFKIMPNILFLCVLFWTTASYVRSDGLIRWVIHLFFYIIFVLCLCLQWGIVNKMRFNVFRCSTKDLAINFITMFSKTLVWDSFFLGAFKEKKSSFARFMVFSMNFFYVYGFMKVTLFCCRNWRNHRIESREWVALNTCQTESIYRHNGLVIVSFGIFSLSLEHLNLFVNCFDRNDLLGININSKGKKYSF